MPVEQRGEQPPSLLLFVTVVVGHVREQVGLKLRDLVDELPLQFSRLTVVVLGPRVRLVAAALDPQLLQPVAQRLGRPAVVFVVATDVLEQAVVLLHEPPLERDDAAERVGDSLLPVAPVEGFELLDGVRLLAHAQALPDDRVEVDQSRPSKELIHLGLPRGVPGGERCQPARLVRRVVVDVHGRVGSPRSHQAIDKRLERRLLLLGARRPVRREGAVLHDPPEVLKAMVAHERVALDVEEHVAGRRGRQQRQAAPDFRLQQLVDRPLSVALDQLQPRLLRQPSSRRLADRRRQLIPGALAERAHSDDAGFLEGPLVVPAHERDQRQVILVAPLLPA